ncbi:cryptochrome/photolyase family protein [Shewanella sp. ER-Te-42B-Light]|uniref:Cryptochrome/photolyase family protein n=2 Tax=Shewanella metallivivens TaxID=2872342 RepID=A0ABT5TK98_9GAMM|nr:cryptochrome/photolyase family protein [Shewanella metallivivens]MDD8059017.1 cryptochrome/photolyase family protein [Shewanella metallivivens]
MTMLYTQASPTLLPQTATLRLILGDQLNASHSWFKDVSPNTVYLIAELAQEATYATHHVQKVCAFFSAMAEFANALANCGHQVIYLTLDETQHYPDLPALLEHIITSKQLTAFDYQQPDEYRLAQQLGELAWPNVTKSKYDSEHFLLPFDDIKAQFAPNKHVKMEFFYRRMRKRFNVLMQDVEPLGGQWNFDQQNREHFKQQDLADIPSPLLFANDVSAILTRLKRHNINTIGKAQSSLLWPVNRRQARQLLDYFCQHLLIRFGRFQDAMTENSRADWSLYHSRLSFAINAKMISPNEVIHKVIQHWQAHQHDISLTQVEGFVRQILGWREYVRGIYWGNMPNYATKNALQAQRPLPNYFWTANTKMNCMHQAIKQSLDYAYAHHIQRLMVTGCFSLLAGLHPDEVDQWYLGIYIDAIEWVEMPNTRGMTQFADGGIVATKPYAASGNYLNKMSDYCKTCHYNVKLKTEANACPFNSLYWHFIERHHAQFSRNPRMTMVYKNWQKMDTHMQQAIIDKANTLLENIENL